MLQGGPSRRQQSVTPCISPDFIRTISPAILDKALRDGPIPILVYLTNPDAFCQPRAHAEYFTEFAGYCPAGSQTTNWHWMCIVGSSPGRRGYDPVAALDDPHYVVRNSHGPEINHKGLVYIPKHLVSNIKHAVWMRPSKP
ncbi:hypothetical protein CVIRNUC_002645 [Coccomyxa viridis]|uniref:Uncharacterized protein n=1 Tax=Coccomyxa viridis TaxID=1274662 RepID=A0AAV1HZJ3_9CHLO|nr:hypothetical protein CVIRNUC_002645 [Coccomyxa viridis]